MKKRKSVNPKLDRRIFRNTAAKTKAINLPNKIYRGGIRF
jgi:hypothetical protein